MSVDPTGELIDAPYDSDLATPSAGDPETERIRLIVREELAAWSKQQQIIGWVTGLEPLTVRLKTGGDAQVSLKDATLALTVGDRVTLQHTGSGYMVTGLAAGPDDAQVTTQGITPVLGLILWPAAQPIPEGWEEATDLAGKFVVHPDGVTFLTGTTGGSAAGHTHGAGTYSVPSAGSSHTHAISDGGGHNHGGNTGSNNNNIDKTGGAGAAARDPHTHSISQDGVHAHGGTTGADTHSHDGLANTSGATTVLPPYSAAYIWIRRVA